MCELSNMPLLQNFKLRIFGGGGDQSESGIFKLVCFT